MTLTEKVEAVEGVLIGLDEAIAAFQAESTLHCKAGCGKCCFKADIEATVIEFLPFALYLHRHQLALEWLDKFKNTSSSICLILNPTQSGAGLCAEYPHRGLICRLFGYSARTDKYDDKELVTCQIIKTEQSTAYNAAVASIKNGGAVPVMSDYYMQLHAIDPSLSREFFPINEAIRRAIETVLQYFAYRDEKDF